MSLGMVVMNILVANLATNFQDLVAKVKNLVTSAPVLGTILRPVFAQYFGMHCKGVKLTNCYQNIKPSLKARLIL